MPRNAPRLRSTTLLTGGLWSLVGLGIVSSLSVDRERPVWRHRLLGAGSRIHSGLSFVGVGDDAGLVFMTPNIIAHRRHPGSKFILGVSFEGRPLASNWHQSIRQKRGRSPLA
jgi:hypothetical protein